MAHGLLRFLCAYISISALSRGLQFLDTGHPPVADGIRDTTILRSFITDGHVGTGLAFDSEFVFNLRSSTVLFLPPTDQNVLGGPFSSEPSVHYITAPY